MMSGVLAKASPAEVIAWSAALLILLVIGMAAATRLKRRIKEDDEPAPALGFTLSDLRQMHRAGQLTDDEFNKAKDKIVAASVKQTEFVPPVPGMEPPRDSADAIRSRRLAREGQREEGHRPDDNDSGGQTPDAD
jgi:hypothetical protein